MIVLKACRRKAYAAIFKRMVAHPNIEVRLDTDFFAIWSQLPADIPGIYTGPIDRYFDFKLGALS